MVDSRLMIAFPGTLTADPRFFWIPIHPLPNHSGYNVGLSPDSTLDDIERHTRGCKMIHASCGGVTHWALAPDDDDIAMTIGWGQNAANGNRSF